jgi:hypothetical protein
MDAGCRSPRQPIAAPAAVTRAAATPVRTPTYTATEAAFAANLNPLNGLPSELAGVSGRRPVAVAVQWSWAAGGHAPTGIQAAELVVEDARPAHPRLTVVTQEAGPDRPVVGPPAPASRLDAAVAEAFGAGLTAVSAEPEIRQTLAEQGLPLTLLPAGAGPDRASPPAGRSRLPGWTYAESPAAGARPVGVVRLAGPQDQELWWRFDPVLGVWRRSWGDQPQVDGSTGEDLTTTNLLLLHSSDLAAPLVGQGEASLHRDGTALVGRWRRSAGERLTLLDSRGMAMALRPGNSWFMVLPPGSPVELGP